MIGLMAIFVPIVLWYLVKDGLINVVMDNHISFS